jgi:hypothetical protein
MTMSGQDRLKLLLFAVWILCMLVALWRPLLALWAWALKWQLALVTWLAG